MKIFRNSLLLCALMHLFPAGFAGNAPSALAQDVDVSAKAPAVIYVIRHAEKPVGDANDPNLTPAGFRRAEALPSLFIPKQGRARLLRPDTIFAADTSKHSNRPIETVMPLSQALHLSIDHDYQDEETAAIAKEILSGRYAGKVVLICWRHGEIPHLAGALGVVDAPAKWDDAVFDQIWEIQWADGNAKLTTLPEDLFPDEAMK